MRLALILVLGLAAPASAWEPPLSLFVWKANMCVYTVKLEADTAAGACADPGACQRLDEQPDRMCVTGGRADQIIAACLAGNLHAAETYNNATANSWYHHVGLAASYVRNGKMSLALYLDDMGDPVAPDPTAYASLTAAKNAIREYARAVGFAQAVSDPLHVDPRALSGYGKTLWWQSLPNLCTDG